MMPNTRKKDQSRSEILDEIAKVPPSAFVNTAYAAAYLGSTIGVLSNWRSQRRGPRYHGSKDFIRYRISDLDLWMSTRATEVYPSTEYDEAAGEGCVNVRDRRTSSEILLTSEKSHTPRENG